jgi:adenine deaminase
LGERPADLVIKGAKVFDSFTGRFREGDLAVAEGRVAAFGTYEGLERVDGKNQYLLPGFIDSHVHVESSLCSPGEFARAVNAHGVTAVIADPHEIANVAGADGLRYFLEASENAPVDIYFMLPSCVPATPLEKGGATLTAADLEPFLSHPRVLGLGEMMNYPGVLARDPEVLRKLSLKRGEKRIVLDGHAPGVLGKALDAYASTGISSDHEATQAGELTAKLASGLFMLLREGSAAKNLYSLLSAVTPFTSRFCGLCTDDRHAKDILADGSVNHLVRLAMASGLIPLPELINMASLNPAVHYGLDRVGALAPGFDADMALYHDLWSFRPSKVWKNGRLTAQDGVSSWPPPAPLESESRVRKSVVLGDPPVDCLRVSGKSGEKVRVIGLRENEIVTDCLLLELPTRKGLLLADPERNIAKIAVFNRYGARAEPAVGFLKNLGLRRGALASTVSHDSHNLVTVGASDADMLLCAQRARDLEGGLVVALDGKILAELALPLGGLMSLVSLSATAAAMTNLGEVLPALGFPEGADPFMPLAFISLPVIPSLKLTDRGLVDVDKFLYVPLRADGAQA